MPDTKIGFPGIPQPLGFNLQVGVQNPTIFAQQLGNAVNKWGAFPVSLPACTAFIIPPGNYMIQLGGLTFLEMWDSNAQFWRIVSQGPGIESVNSDGVNVRLCNRTGSVVGAVITNSGSGYASSGSAYGAAVLPTITAPNGQTFRAIAGGSISTTITKTLPGAGFTLPPILVIDPPPLNGIQATATTTISAGALGTITVTNQGAGYVTVPNVTVINAPGDTTGNGPALTAAGQAALTTTITTSGGTAGATGAAADVIAAIVPTNLPSAANTSVPSLTIVNGSIGTGLAATAIMCVTQTALTTTGLSHAANGSLTLIGSGVTAGTATLVNPAISTGLFTPTLGWIAPQTAAAAGVIVYGGLHQIAPVPVTATTSDGTISAATTYGTNTFGGATDQSWIQPV